MISCDWSVHCFSPGQWGHGWDQGWEICLEHKNKWEEKQVCSLVLVAALSLCGLSACPIKRPTGLTVVSPSLHCSLLLWSDTHNRSTPFIWTQAQGKCQGTRHPAHPPQVQIHLRQIRHHWLQIRLTYNIHGHFSEIDFSAIPLNCPVYLFYFFY